MIKPLRPQPAGAKIPLHGIQLGHRVRDWCAGSKDDAPFICDLVQILNLGQEIGGFLCAHCVQPLDLRRKREVLIKMCLIDIQSINAQLLKRDCRILTILVRLHDRCIFSPKCLDLFFRLLYRKYAAVPLLHLSQ